MPQGAIGFRWQEKKGQWNLQLKDGLDGTDIEPTLSLVGACDGALTVSFMDFASGGSVAREVPVRFVDTSDGRVPVTTVFDLLMAHFGVGRGLGGAYPASYDDEDSPYTPAWQEKFTGISRNTVIQFAREWASTAEKTRGKCMIIVGSGVNHWYHANLMYRSGITALVLCGCVGVNGGGLNHYTGQEKLVPAASWSALAMALAAPAERAVLSLRPHRPVAIRSGLCRPSSARRSIRETAHHGSAGGGGAHGLAAVLSAVRPQPDRGGAPSGASRRQK
jgi:nitrate reductase alpha subunit